MLISGEIEKQELVAKLTTSAGQQTFPDAGLDTNPTDAPKLHQVQFRSIHPRGDILANFIFVQLVPFNVFRKRTITCRGSPVLQLYSQSGQMPTKL